MEPTTDLSHTQFLNRVTPLSKAFALILFITLPILTLYIGYQKGIKDSSSETVTVAETGSLESNIVSPEASSSERFSKVEREEYSVSMPDGYVFSRRQVNGYVADYYKNGGGDEITIVINPVSESFVRIDSVRSLIQNPYNAQAQSGYGHQSTADLSDTSYTYEYVKGKAVLIYAGGTTREIIGGSYSKPILYSFSSANHPEYLEEIVRSFTLK